MSTLAGKTKSSTMAFLLKPIIYTLDRFCATPYEFVFITCQSTKIVFVTNAPEHVDHEVEGL
jgi:hypothetical protein